MEELLNYSSRLYAFDYFGLIVVVSMLECLIPRRPAGDTLRLRWAGNIGITILDSVLVRMIFPVLGLGVAAFCTEHGWGLFNQINLPRWVEIGLTIMLLDVFIYAQHYLLHRVPLLWRFHRTHHTDQDFDFTTGLRFHPVESIFTTGTTLAATAALGATPVAVLLSQLLFIFVSFFQHGNLQLPTSVDRVVRLFLITPDMHRIHHSENSREIMSNFGNAFPLWDRLFHTYISEPASGHDSMRFGVPEFKGRKHLTIPWMLAQPFLQEEIQATVTPMPSQIR